MEKAESITNENLLKSDDSDIKVIDHTIFHILMRIIQLILLLLGLICVCFVIGKYCFLVFQYQILELKMKRSFKR